MWASPPTYSKRNERIPLDGFDMAALEVTLCGGTPPPPNGGPPRTERSPLPCGHLPTPWGVTLYKGALFTSLQTPYKIKLTACTRKHLNINVTNTGKGNNRRWQAPGGQRGQRANSAGRFRCGCTRKYTLRVNPSTSFAGPPFLSGEAYFRLP